RDYPLYFKLKSFSIEVLQITNDGKTVTFADSSGKISTLILPENISLFKELGHINSYPQSPTF
ncbi:MAG: hypothetical protein PHC38_12280, partial [Weeksellaceae bacterium]|nr:hypothetical protein [Weeksellaceae bacterium]